MPSLLPLAPGPRSRLAWLAFWLIALAAPAVQAQREVRGLAMSGRLDEARAALERARAAGGGPASPPLPASPEWIEAQSWLARGELAQRQYDRAFDDARATMAAVEQARGGAPLDADAHLATAMGAAIEVHAQAQAGRGERDQALAFLREQLRAHADSSIAARIQKNLHLLALEGRAPPALSIEDSLGPPAPNLAALRGRPVLLFFWAHWCGDCKAEAQVIAELRAELGPRGLVVLAPTRPYGFVGGGEPAEPAAERAHIDQVRQGRYAALADVPMPYGEANFLAWGASTVPTLAFIDRQGIVRLYHAGTLDHDALRARIEPWLREPPRQPRGSQPRAR